MAKKQDTPEVVAQTVMLPIGKIDNNHGQVDGLPKNPRIIRDKQYEALKRSVTEAPEMLTYRELLVYPFEGRYVVIGGNMRLRVLKDLGEKAVPCKVLPEDTPVEKLREYTIKDNTSGGEWDWDDLANAWDESELDAWGLELPVGMDTAGDEEDENYSRKIEVPIYEPTGEDVPVKALTDTAKYDGLVDEIRKAKIDSEIKDFLLTAATRHIVFDYAKIADFYANATPEVQSLMERSALVIIDFDKAVENGFVKMTEEIRNEYTRQNGSK